MKEKYFSDPSAIIDPGSKIGPGTKIWHHSHVMKSAIVGKNCVIGQNCFLAGKIGEGCKLQNNVNVYDGVELSDWVFCGPSMTFTNVLNPRAKYPKNGQYVSTFVGTGATLGANCTIVCGVTIGNWAFVGAGSVVTKNVPAHALVFGNPAKLKGWVCECGHKLPDEFKKTTCNNCHRIYSKSGKIVKETK